MFFNTKGAKDFTPQKSFKQNILFFFRNFESQKLSPKKGFSAVFPRIQFGPCFSFLSPGVIDGGKGQGVVKDENSYWIPHMIDEHAVKKRN